jgi:hypothetical protein
MAASSNNGKTFDPERIINPEPTGACACCGLKAFSAPNGNLFVMYRTARNGHDRDETLLRSNDSGRTFQKVFSDPWQIEACPMSLVSLNSLSNKVQAAWETAGKIWFGQFGEHGMQGPFNPSAKGTQKYPAVASNKAGETLLVWVENSAWGKGGTLAWQILDAQTNYGGASVPASRPSQSARKEAVPAWSFAAVVCRPDDSFEVIY